jgi:hypothetical protein
VSARIVLPKPVMPCSKFLFLATIFPKNVGEGGGERFKKKFPGIKKRVKKFFWKSTSQIKKFSVQIPAKPWVKPLFLDQYL